MAEIEIGLFKIRGFNKTQQSVTGISASERRCHTVNNWVGSVLLFGSLLAPFSVMAGMEVVDQTNIVSLAISGGADSANPGTSCFTISSPVASSCTNGMIAIPNNNSELISAALAAQSSERKVWLYYSNSSASQHCPGLAFTACTATSIMIY